MPKFVSKNYWPFYLEGRADKLLRHDIDIDALVTRLTSNDDVSLRDAVREACATAASALAGSKDQRKWVDKHKTAIADAGGDSDAAHSAWRQGRIDELAYSLEQDVVDAISDEVLDEEEEEDDDDEDDEDEEDEEDE